MDRCPHNVPTTRHCATCAHFGHPTAPVVDPWPADAQYALGDLVQKKGRASWRGMIVGWYRTDITALGYAIESIYEPGSVQIYPEAAITALIEGEGR